MSQYVTKCHTFSNLWYKATLTFYGWIWLGTTLRPAAFLPYSVESNRGSRKDRNAGSKAIQSHVIGYVLALILLKGYKGLVQAQTSRHDASLLLVRVLNVFCRIVLLLLFTSELPPLLLSPTPPLPTLFFFDLKHFVYVSNPRLRFQRLPAAAGAYTLSRLASSFIFCSSSHAMVTKASTSTCFPHHTTLQSAHTCTRVDTRSSHIYTGSARP